MKYHISAMLNRQWQPSYLAQLFVIFCAAFFQSLVAMAAPASLTYQGRILKSDGTPLEYSAVSFIFQVTDPTGQCVVYQEQINGINMTNSSGVFDVPIGTGTVSYPTSGSFTVLDAFNNSATFTCSGGSSTYTPINTDGRLLRVQFYDGSGWKTVSPDNVIRSVPFAGYAASAQKLGTNIVSDFVLKANVNSGASCGSGNFLTWDSSTMTFGCAAGGSGSGTVSNVTASSPLSVTNGTSTPNITIPVATSSQNGYLSSSDWTTFNNKIGATTSFSGDVSGVYSSTSVDKLKGTALSISALTSGQFLKYNGTNWVNATIAQSDVSGLSTTLSGVVMQSQFPASCAANQTLTFVSPSGSFSCSSIAINGSQVSGNISGNAAGFTGSLAGDISGTQGATSVDKIKGVSISATAPTSNQVLQYDGTNWTPASISTTPSGSAGGDLSGTYPNPTVATVGTSTAANVHSAEVLANAATSSNTASAIVKRDASGNFTAGTITANLTGAASANVLKTGDSMSGNLTFLNTKGSVYTDTGSNTASITGPSSAIGTSYVLRLPTGQGTANQVLTNDGSGNLSWTTPSSTATSYSGVLPIANGGTNSSTALTNGKIMVSAGGAIVEGAATSTLQTTTLADGKILVGNSSNIATAVTPSSDVSMTDTGAFTVTKIQGTAVSSTTPTTSGQVLRYNGTNWTPNFVSMADLRSTITGASALTSCTSGQTLTWSAATDNLACSNISIGASNFSSQTANTFLAAPNGSTGTPTFRTIASADLPSGGYDTTYFKNGGNSFGGAATLGTNDSNTLGLKTAGTTRMTIDTSGNVGIGTTSPSEKLQVVGGNIRVDNASSFVVTAAGGLHSSDLAGGAGSYFQMGTSSSGLAFDANEAGNNGPEMVILPSGNVGIGTNASDTKLEVVGASSTDAIIKSFTTGTTATDYAGIRLMSSNSTSAGGQLYVTGVSNSDLVMQNSEGGGIRFQAGGGNRMFVDSAGNVGIGTLTPGSPLTVNGVIESKSGGIKFPDGTTQTTSGVGARSMASAASATSTTSTSFVDMPNMSVTVTTNSASTLIMVNGGGCYSNSANAYGYFQLLEDGVTIASTTHQYINSGAVQNMTFQWMKTPTAGSHTYKVQWATSAGSLTCSYNASTRNIIIWQ